MVLGASGHLGSAITRALLERGERVTALVRRAVLPPNLAGVAARFVQVGDDEPLTDLARGHRLIIDAAAPHPIGLHDRVDAHALATRHVDRVRRTGLPVLHLSSWAVAAQKPRDATAAYGRRTHPYFAVKERLEADYLAVREVPVSIVRLGMVVGPWDVRPRYACAIPQLVAGEHPYVPEAHLNILDVRDAARELVESPYQGGAHTLWGHDVSFAEALEYLIRDAGAPPPVGSVPSEAAVLALTAWETARLSPPGPPALGMMLVHEMLPGVRRREHDPRPRALTPLDVTIRDAVRWYRRMGYC